MKRIITIVSGLFFLVSCSSAQPLSQKKGFTRQDTLRGSITSERAWWDVQRYDVTVTPDYDSKSIKGSSKITFKMVKDEHSGYMQIDLQEPMEIDSVRWNGRSLLQNKTSMKKEGNAYFILVPKTPKGSQHAIELFFHGTPRAAQRPPWDGGWIWSKDAQGRPWMSVAVQGLGASAWFPCKDHQSDEPDQGASLSVTVPANLVAVANGKLTQKLPGDNFNTWVWEVKNPINNYNIIPYIGHYVNFTETFNGEKGALNCSYWVLDYNLEKAKQQFKQAPMTLKALEHWFGPFPWYEDDFKLVEAPHLGMEHQSAVAYGNKYQNGYLGTDLSGTGVGLKWDFIIVHEVGHEWYGNNITTKDIADMWIHEGFTNYSETLFTEYHFGKEDAMKYVQGLRKNIRNDIPIIGTYGVNQEGSGDMYHKGANLIHTIRQIINDDEKFRQILRGMNKDFWHQTVTSKQIEQYISNKAGKDLSKVFDQYLRATKIPVLNLETEKDELEYYWSNCIEGFDMPVKLTNGEWLYPTTKKQTIKGKNYEGVGVDKNFYINVKKDD